MRMRELANAFHTFVLVSGLSSWNGVYTLYTKDDNYSMFPQFKYILLTITMLGGSLVTTAWHFLVLQMEGQPPAMEGSCEYNE
jgi:hypothetical protein